MNVMMFVLATLAMTFTATVDTQPPRGGRDAKPMNLAILISDDGMSVKTRDGTVATIAPEATTRACSAASRASRHRPISQTRRASR